MDFEARLKKSVFRNFVKVIYLLCVCVPFRKDGLRNVHQGQARRERVYDQHQRT